MLIMAKDRSYGELLKDVKGRNVHIWTCNTCARMCYGLGGKDSAERLARKLREDGVNVTGTDSAAASCIMSQLKRATVPGGTDIVISLTCDIGAVCASEAFGTEVLNPVTTFGPGMISDDGPMLVTVGADGRASAKCLLDVCAPSTPEAMPFVPRDPA